MDFVSVGGDHPDLPEIVRVQLRIEEIRHRRMLLTRPIAFGGIFIWIAAVFPRALPRPLITLIEVSWPVVIGALAILLVLECRFRIALTRLVDRWSCATDHAGRPRNPQPN